MVIVSENERKRRSICLLCMVIRRIAHTPEIIGKSFHQVYDRYFGSWYRRCAPDFPRKSQSNEVISILESCSCFRVIVPCKVSRALSFCFYGEIRGTLERKIANVKYPSRLKRFKSSYSRSRSFLSFEFDSNQVRVK